MSIYVRCDIVRDGLFRGERYFHIHTGKDPEHGRECYHGIVSKDMVKKNLMEVTIWKTTENGAWFYLPQQSNVSSGWLPKNRFVYEGKCEGEIEA